jgi:SAM-dependent MidA family methyltransferase
MAINTDPRERLIQLGNELLDAIYHEEEVIAQTAFIEKVMRLPEAEQSEALDKLIAEYGMGHIFAVSLHSMIATQQREKLVEQYVSMRSTIEAMEKRAAEPSMTETTNED